VSGEEPSEGEATEAIEAIEAAIDSRSQPFPPPRFVRLQFASVRLLQAGNYFLK